MRYSMISVLPLFLLMLTLAASTPQDIRFYKGYRNQQRYPTSTGNKNGYAAGGASSNPASDVVKASNSLGFALLKELPSSGNVFISPLSVSMAMSIVHMGARNRTAEEMARVLRYDSFNLKSETLYPGYKELMNGMNAAERSSGGGNDNYDLEIANALLVEKSFDILPEFKDKARQFYDAAAESVSFGTHPEAVVESVNGWAAWKTKNKISKVLKNPLDPLTKLFLLNAIYFKGTWKTKFDQRLTMPDTFYNEGKVPKTVPMMRQRKKFNYGFVTSVQSHVLELPYMGERMRMLILLPEKRDGLQTLESKLTRELVESVPAMLRMVTVQVTLPRFTLEEDYDMIDIFKRLGMKSLFDADKANLTGISPQKGLYVTKIIHKSIVDVNEEGSEAATVTGVSAGVRTGGPLHPLFTADHPFVFFIRDTRTQAILFVGRVNVL